MPGRKTKQKPGVPVAENQYKTPELLTDIKRIIDKLNQDTRNNKSHRGN